MPIRGLSDARRLPRLGKIRLGVQVANPNGSGTHPAKTDHFVCPPDVLEAVDGQVPFCSCPTPGPLQLPIMFVSNDLEQTAPQFYKAYRGRAGLACVGDGFEATAQLDKETRLVAGKRGEFANPAATAAWAGDGPKIERRIDCLGEGFDGAPACPMYAAKKCARQLSLMFAIPSAPGLGVYQLDTGSVYSILNVNSFLAFLGEVTGGRIAGIPLTMYAEPRDVRHDGKPTKATIIRLDSSMTVGQLQDAVAKPYIAAAQIAAPSDEPDEDPNMIEGEAREVDEAGDPPLDVEAERQRCRDWLGWAHANWSGGDFGEMILALHGELKRADAWTAKGNLAVTSLPPDVAKQAADYLEKRIGPDRFPQQAIPATPP